jgi:hypothetical protein
MLSSRCLAMGIHVTILTSIGSESVVELEHEVRTAVRIRSVLNLSQVTEGDGNAENSALH